MTQKNYIKGAIAPFFDDGSETERVAQEILSDVENQTAVEKIEKIVLGCLSEIRTPENGRQVDKVSKDIAHFLVNN